MVAVIRGYSPQPPQPLAGEEQPLPQGPAPLLNRAWSRRGWAAPPMFGKSVPALMMETTILIQRDGSVQNDIGGYASTSKVTVYQGPAHAELVESAPTYDASNTETVLGPTNLRHYELFGQMPADPAAMPRKGDLVTFSDGYQIRQFPIMHVGMAAGLTDHWEAETDEFEA